MAIVLLINKKEEYLIIPNEAIRVRVIANSNDEYDIKIKEELKDKLNIKINSLLNKALNISDARQIINSNLDFINSFVEKSLKELNYKTDYSINFGMNYFPKKIFKGVLYNSGLYESLVITLGNGEGPNYWCVLYPPLCSIDIDKEDIEYRSFIKDLLNKSL